nr:dynein light chain Tctex-type protein 2B-like [Parasteatoda tepidariorum]
MPKKVKLLNIRPPIDRKFDSEAVKDLIKSLATEELGSKEYEYIYASEWTRTLSRKIHDALKELEDKQYKFIVQVIIGEKLGQGLKTSAGCLWDDDADTCVSVTISRDTLYCVIAVYALYCYCWK